MTITAQTPLPRRPGLGPALAEPPGSRPAPGTAVLVRPEEVMPLAGYLLRHGPAVALAPELHEPVVAAPFAGVALPWTSHDMLERREGMLERAEVLTAAAGFEVAGAEALHPSEVRGRLEVLAGEEDLGCVVVATRSPRVVRALARSSGAPVLALPPGAAAAGGPAVFDAELADRAVPAVAGCLATEHVVVVAEYEVAPTGTLMRRATHPILVPELDALVRRHRADAFDGASKAVERAKWLAAEHGLEALAKITSEVHGLLSVARDREGIVVTADGAGRRGPALLRAALRERRPVLLLPAS